MNLIEEYNKKYEFFKDITGEAMKVHRKYHSGLLESAYEAALKYLLELKGYKVERQVYLPMFWDDVPLDTCTLRTRSTVCSSTSVVTASSPSGTTEIPSLVTSKR